MSVVDMLERIGTAHGKTPGQVALNWLLRQDGVIVIPGAKNGRQALENAGASGWRMGDDEAAELGRVT
jgi:aryl-alcohol dehydrogenase-like predicted oxidoreductase